MKISRLVPLILILASGAVTADARNLDVADIVTQTKYAHGIDAWNNVQLVETDVQVTFGGNKVVDGTFTFEAHGPKARYDRADGASIIFDGKDAYVTPASAEAEMGRFHVLTWPWFIMAPFKMDGAGITLSQAGVRPVEGKNYTSLLQTFDSDMGDTPDDWYRFFIDPSSNLIDAMSYIVTYGKETEKANQQPSIIRYYDYTEAAPRISQRYEFWLWDSDLGQYAAEKPKGSATVSDIKFPARSAATFTIPSDSRILELPAVNKTVVGYDDLLLKYVRDSGVDYASWSQNSTDLEALNRYIQSLEKTSLKGLSQNAKKAFYINLYNAAMLREALANFPLQSVKDLGNEPFSVFKKKLVNHQGQSLSLDEIEKGILLKQYPDPRIHFAVNCASESCPPLRAEPFTAESLENQLDEQTRLFANSERAVQFDKRKRKVRYSELFKWYAEDFGSASPAVYLNRYREEMIPGRLKTDWIPYDWSLNSAR